MPKSKLAERRYRTPAEKLSMVRRMLYSIGKQMAHYSDVDELRDLLEIHDDLDKIIDSVIIGLREQGYTWSTIGKAMGTTGEGVIMRIKRHRRLPRVPAE